MPLTPKRLLRQFRYAMYFNGINNYVQTGYSNIPITTSFTGMVWMNSLGSTGKFQHALVWGVLTPIVVGWIDGGYSSLRVYAYDGAWKYVHLADPNTVRGQWVHVTSVVIDNQALYGYLNASLKGSVSIGVTNKPTSRPLYVGCQNGWGFFYGYISQALLYTRSLSDSEIQWNYQNPDKPIRNGLVLWLQADPQYIKDIDNDGVLEWIDLSGYNNHGKIYGAQLVQLIKTPSRVLNPVRVLKPAR